MKINNSMFEEILKKIDAFNELKGCVGKYTLIDKDGEITFTTPTDSLSMPTYKDKETYLVCLKKPNKELLGHFCIESVISAGYNEEINNLRIQKFTKFMNSVEGRNLFNT